ncbi:MAG TPA: T9SS type A sorting domain-containing protein [Saprospiraceae bacterium]|nr:T9SS type A sorting domain-containing protein [Saprospiraceae bacterium]
MKQIFLLLLFFISLHVVQAQTIVYEDFEGGTPDIAWVGLNGTFNGAVTNPTPDAVNSSAFVGSYTNNPDVDFSFALGTLSAPVDLTNLNLIKMKVWSPIAPTQVLFKFEGGGNAVEMFRDIKVAGQWVEYSFDLGAGAPFTMMDKVLVAFNPFVTGSTETFYFDDITAQRAIQVYETFEGGAALPWVAINGFLTAPVPNPDSNSVNGSDNVGQFVKDTFEYSFVVADLGSPIDLSILNQFKLQVHAQAPTQLLLKLEGAGPAVERFANIGLANEWQEYTFDFSDVADSTYFSKIVLFFDPFVKTSVDTYYFDNLIAVSEGSCKGVALNPDMIDDFECNRHATYVNGWDSLSVVNNPEPNAINSSPKVGKYVDPIAEPWATLLIDYQNPIDLSVKNQLKVKIWSPREVPILFKLEGGSSPAKEVWVNVTTAGEWVEYEVDFGDQALANHRKIAIFFNGGNDPQDGDVYYIDDIQWGVQSVVTVEDFELGVLLPWAPLNDQMLLHGTFQRVANPDPTDPNTSLFVGKYTKGTAAFSTLAAVAPGAIDISSRPQYNLDVYAPGPGTVVMQLESVSEGNKEVERTITTGGVWQHLSFDFSEYQSITDWESLRLIFNPGVAEPGAMFFFDNLTQSASTVDPCEGVIAQTQIIDDFECQRNYDYLAGAAQLSVVGNPLVTVENSSSFVGLYLDPPAEPWVPLCVDFSGGIDLASFNQLSLQILSDQAVPILLKLEGGAVSPAFEVWTAYTKPNEWETITGDFSSQVGTDHTRACIFFNAGVETTEVDNYYIDNLQFAHAPFTGCLINFDEPAFISDTWKFFPSDDAGEFAIVDNPDPTGINTSAEVGRAVEKASSGQPWQGMYTDLPAPIVFATDKIVTMKVWSPQVTTVTMKLEVPLTPGAPASSGDVTVPITVAGEWTEVAFDFSTAPNPIPDDGKYTRVTLIFDINNIPAADVTYYFDDISLTTGECATSSSNGPVGPKELSVSPNPVSDNLFIEELGKVSRLDIYNLYGQRINSVMTENANSTFVNVAQLYPGTYILTGYSSKGELLALSRFVKL